MPCNQQRRQLRGSLRGHLPACCAAATSATRGSTPGAHCRLHVLLVTTSEKGALALHSPADTKRAAELAAELPPRLILLAVKLAAKLGVQAFERRNARSACRSAASNAGSRAPESTASAGVNAVAVSSNILRRLQNQRCRKLQTCPDEHRRERKAFDTYPPERS